MSNEPARHDFDWVTERRNCTAKQAFDRLKDMAERNVETREEQVKR